MYYVLSPLYPYPTPAGARGTHRCIGRTRAFLDLASVGPPVLCAPPQVQVPQLGSRGFCVLLGQVPIHAVSGEAGQLSHAPCCLIFLKSFLQSMARRLGFSFPAPHALPRLSITEIYHHALGGQSECRDSPRAPGLKAVWSNRRVPASEL